MRHLRWIATAGLLLLAAVFTLTSDARKATADDLADQKERQKQIQAETDRLVRRIETMIRVLEYNRLDESGGKDKLQSVRGILDGLSKEQMTALIAALEKAGKTKGDARTEELKKAQAHRAEIIDGLKSILARFDAVRSLDQAADRLDKMANDQVDLFLLGVQLPFEPESVKLPTRRYSTLELRTERLFNEQGLLGKDVAELVKQVGELKGKLPADQKERASRFEQTVRQEQILRGIEETQRAFRHGGIGEARDAVWKRAAERQWQLAGQFLGLSRGLRPLPDRATTIRESSHKLGRVIDDQVSLRADVVNPPKREGGDVNRDEPPDPVRRGGAGMENGRRLRDDLRLLFGRGGRNMVLPPLDPEAIWGKEVGDRQGWLEHQTRGVRGLLAAHLADLAGKLSPAEKDMRTAQLDARGKKKANEVTKSQDGALEQLREVKKELDRLLAEEEKNRSDPLANLQDALARIDRLIKEQTDLRDRTAVMNKVRQAAKLPNDAPKQADLARQANAVKQQVAGKDQATQSLDRASKAMEQASKSLAARQGTESQARQNEALKGLEEARKALVEEAKAIEKRRDDIAKLEDADRKLAELIQSEKAVAKQASEKAAKDAPELAKKQGDLTPPTREVGKDLKSAAPEAAKKVEAGAKAMEAAKSNLDKKELKPAAKKADEAAQKLEQARKELAKALEQKKAEEAAAQAQAQPNIDPASAAQQLAKALEQTQAAQQQAQQAQRRSDQQDLAELQKQVAKQAGKVDAAEAKKPASEAAEALKKGDLSKALQAQKQALNKLEAAAQKSKADPTKGKQSQQSSPSPANAKNAGELAQAQKALMDATQALSRSQQSTQAAMSALGQARAQAPQAVQPQLGQAGQQLAKAAQALQQGSPNQAGQAQGQAADQLARALATLRAAQGQAQGQRPGQGQPRSQAQQGQGQQPGQAQARANQPGRSQERNETRGTGNRVPDGQGADAKAQTGDTRGNSLYINLPPRQRELIRQAMTEKLPAEYAALIQQYYQNIARGKSAPQAKTPPKR
jgi:hypothetical protein